MIEKYSIRTQILILFTILSFVILLITAGLALNNISTVGDKTTSIASDAMIDQIHRNMLLSSKESANVIERQAFTAFSTIQALADSAEQILVDDIFEETQSYSDLEVSGISDAVEDIDYGFLLSKSTSTHYTPTSTILSLEINSTIKKSANMDLIFKSLFEDNPEFLWFKLVITEGKIMRRFPGSLISADRNFDPTVETWYSQAILTNGPIFTPPNYETNIGKWVITIAIPLHNADGDNIGVVSGDLTLNAIQAKVGEIQFLDTGFASLILRYPIPAFNGMVVAHRDWDPSRGTVSKLSEIEVNKDGSPAITTLHEVDLLTTEPHVSNYVKDGEKFLVSNTLPIFDVFVLLIIVQEQEAINGVIKIQEEISTTEDQIILAAIIISILTFISVLAIGLTLSNRISAPIVELSDTARRIVANVTEKDYLDGVNFDPDDLQDGEIGNLQRSFSSMIESLKSANSKKK